MGKEDVKEKARGKGQGHGSQTTHLVSSSSLGIRKKEVIQLRTEAQAAIHICPYILCPLSPESLNSQGKKRTRK